MTASGIYLIRNTTNGKIYVGSAIHVARRWNEHKSGLDRNIHRNEKLQHAWNKYGKECFVFLVIEHVELVDQLITREQFWIDKLLAANRENYNINPLAKSRLGARLSVETRAKLAASHKGKVRSKEASDKAAASNKGKKRTAEMRERMGLSRRGKPFTDEHRKNIGEANRGRIFSAETRKKISAFHKGRTLTAEHRAKISAAKMGHPTSETTRAKISATKRQRYGNHDV